MIRPIKNCLFIVRNRAKKKTFSSLISHFSSSHSKVISEISMINVMYYTRYEYVMARANIAIYRVSEINGVTIYLWIVGSNCSHFSLTKKKGHHSYMLKKTKQRFSRKLNIKSTDMYKVIRFYSWFNLKLTLF